jgi:hypothetical protein
MRMHLEGVKNGYRRQRLSYLCVLCVSLRISATSALK